MDKPRWLDEEPEIKGLLEQILDRLDGRSAEEWKQPLGITINEKRLPGLFRIGESADRQWSLLKSLGQDYQLFEIKLDTKRNPYDPEYSNARIRFNLGAEGLLRDWLQRPKQRPVQKLWQEAVARYQDSFPGTTERLAARPIRVDGKSCDEVVEGFVAIKQYQGRGLTLRQLSARCFWGCSKLLDDREELVVNLYPDIALQHRPLLVNVYLPERINGILFIENQDSYASAIRGVPVIAGDLALVYCAGFRSSAQRIRDRQGVCLHYHRGAGEGAWKDRFEAWWFEDVPSEWPIYFWGDLDYAGMGILKALRRRFDAMQAWQPGYESLLKLLEQGGGHAPETSDKQEQTDPGSTGCLYADSVLLPAIRACKRFIDQEGVF